MTAPPFRLEAIDHVLLLVSDTARATAFYTEVLGCEVISRMPEYGMIQFRAGRSTVDLVDVGGAEGAWARPGVRGGRNLDHLCLALVRTDEQALRGHLAAHRVAIVEEGTHSGFLGETLSLYVADPDGNRIELKLPPVPDQR
jgi:glyoxylase I family protein